MAHTFIAYIDESGDDGLPGHFRMPGSDGGPSNWLGIGATVWRLSRDLDMVGCAKNILQQLPPRKRSKSLHFTNLDHAQRVMALNLIQNQAIQIASVFAYKPTIPDGIFTLKNQFYHYTTRYLIERISWMCRDYRQFAPEGDGRVKLIFSRRGGMSYEDFQAYLQHLQNLESPNVKIHWPVIDIDGVEARDHSSRYGLQLADLAISGLRACLELDPYGNVEPRYAEILRSRVYRRQGNYLSYGAKLYPAEERILEFAKNDVAPAHLADWLRIFG